MKMAVQVVSQIRLNRPRKFTYVSPDVVLFCVKCLTINTLQWLVRGSFSAPSASQPCGAFLFVAKIKVVKMDTAGGMDWQAKRLEGKVFTVRFIDSAGQIHLEETGLALIPGVDEYEIVK